MPEEQFSTFAHMQWNQVLKVSRAQPRNANVTGLPYAMLVFVDSGIDTLQIPGIYTEFQFSNGSLQHFTLHKYHFFKCEPIQRIQSQFFRET